MKTNELGDSPSEYVDERVTITTIPLSLSSPEPSSEDPSKFSFSKLFQHSAPPFEGPEEAKLAYKVDIVHKMFKRGVYSEDITDEELSAQVGADKKRHAHITNLALPRTHHSNTTLAYFLKNHDSPGKFDVEKAKALNVPVGKLYSTLKAGQDVEIPSVNEEGEPVMKTIKSEDVLMKPTPGKAVLILDIPGLQYVKKVLENDTLNSEMVKNSDIVVHMLADDVASDENYIKWMESFKDSSQVIFFPLPKLFAF